MAGESRRVLMTRRMIKDALIDLMDETEFSKISVSDVCQRADINRSTFYSHYKDTRQVLSECEDDIMARLPNVDNPDQDLYSAMISILRFIKENSELIKVMVIKRKDDSFMEKLVVSVMSRYGHLASDPEKESTKISYLFCISGIVGIIKQWISSGFSIPLEEFTAIALDLAVKVTR